MKPIQKTLLLAALLLSAPLQSAFAATPPRALEPTCPATRQLIPPFRPVPLPPPICPAPDR